MAEIRTRATDTPGSRCAQAVAAALMQSSSSGAAATVSMQLPPLVPFRYLQAISIPGSAAGSRAREAPTEARPRHGRNWPTEACAVAVLRNFLPRPPSAPESHGLADPQIAEADAWR